MPSSYQDAALAALELYLQKGVFEPPIDPLVAGETPGSLAKIVVGWSDQKNDLIYPTIGIDSNGTGTREKLAPADIGPATLSGVNGQDPTIEVLIAVALVEFPIDVNVWAEYKPQRSAVMSALETSLYGQGDASLCLDTPDYFGQTVTLRKQGAAQNIDGESSVGQNEFRATFSLMAEMLEVIPTSCARLTEMQLDWAASEGAATVAAERQTIFTHT